MDFCISIDILHINLISLISNIKLQFILFIKYQILNTNEKKSNLQEKALGIYDIYTIL